MNSLNKVIKNKFILILLAIAVFIPTVVAVVSYNRDKNGPVNTKSVVSMTMSDLEGNEYVFSKDSEAEEKVIQMFVDINSTSSEIGVLPDPLQGTPFYLVVMSNGATDSSYQYYFDSLGTEAYYMNGDGKAFKIDENAASRFLKSPYAASIYSDSRLPVMTLAGAGDDVKPAAASWFYKDYSGGFSARDCSSLTVDENVVYSTAGNISLSFDMMPDYFYITVKNASDGKILFDDLYDNISSLKFDGAAQVIVSASAKWYEDSEKGYYGEINYNFAAEISAPAEFYLGVSQINVGEFVTVTGKNVKNIGDIKFSSEPDIGYTPVFYSDGDAVRTLIPIAMGKEAGTYKLTFTYGGGSQELNLTVKDKTYRTGTYNVNDEKAAVYTSENITAAEETLKSVFSKGSDTRYFDGGDFAKVFEDGSINRYYGRLYTIKPSGTVFREEGLEYKAAEGAEVKASASGEVVYAGSTDYTGNVVIIEHGYGLKTMYAHLSEISVSVGDSVEKGTVVGKCGSTGFTNTSGVYFGMYIGDVQVCPYATWYDGDWKCVPFNEG